MQEYTESLSVAPLVVKMNKSLAIPVSSCLARDVHLCIMVYIWIRSWNCGCPVTWSCYQLIAKLGNKTATATWPDPYSNDFKCNNKRWFLINEPIVEHNIVPAASHFFRSLIWNEWYLNLPNQFKILTSSLLIRNKNLSSLHKMLKSPYTLLILSYIHSLVSLLIIHWQTKCSSSSITVHWEQSRASMDFWGDRVSHARFLACVSWRAGAKVQRDVCVLWSGKDRGSGNIFRVTGHLCREFTGEFPAQRPVTRSFDVFFDLRLNKRLSKPSRGWWSETPSWSLWRQRNGIHKVAYKQMHL